MTPYNAFALWAWPLQASTAFWSSYWTNIARLMTEAPVAVPPGATEASEAVAAGATAVTKGTRTPV